MPIDARAPRDQALAAYRSACPETAASTERACGYSYVGPSVVELRLEASERVLLRPAALHGPMRFRITVEATR